MGEKGKKSLVDYVQKPVPELGGKGHGLDNLLITSIIIGHQNSNAKRKYYGLDEHYSDTEIGIILEYLTLDERARGEYKEHEPWDEYRKSLAEKLRSRLFEVLKKTENLAKKDKEAPRKIIATIQAELEKKRKKASFKTLETCDNLKVTIKQLREKFGDKAYPLIPEKFGEAFEYVKQKGMFEVLSEYRDVLERIVFEIGRGR